MQLGLGKTADEGVDFVHLTSLRGGFREIRKLTASVRSIAARFTRL